MTGAQRGHFERVAGADLIAAERRRQVEQEGWTPEHDAQHGGESLAIAACCYALPPQMRKWRTTGVGPIPTLWPWNPGYWKPKPDDRVRELVKAGALIAAEIDRLQAQALDRADHGITS